MPPKLASQVTNAFAITGNLFRVKETKVGAASRRKAWGGLARRLLLVLLAGVGATLVFAYDLPTVDALRQWSESTGAWFPILFFALYVGLTQFPIPRTVFTLSSGILFGPWLGVILAIAATTISAALSLVLVRFLGRDLVRAHMTNRRLLSLDHRLEQRGWLAVLSLRMIAGVPFSVLNYACAVSSIRFWPFVLATAVGSAPNTVAVALLGDALIDGFDVRLVIITAALMVLGIAGLILDARTPVVDRVKSHS